MSDLDFREKVIQDLAELRNDMKSLIGNGQPGRIGLIEKKLSRHDWLLGLIIGGLIVVKALFKF